jgi:hypothetical protein
MCLLLEIGPAQLETPAQPAQPAATGRTLTSPIRNSRSHQPPLQAALQGALQPPGRSCRCSRPSSLLRRPSGVASLASACRRSRPPPLQAAAPGRTPGRPPSCAARPAPPAPPLRLLPVPLSARRQLRLCGCCLWLMV